MHDLERLAELSEDELVLRLSGALRDQGIKIPEGPPATRRAVRQVIEELPRGIRIPVVRPAWIYEVDRGR